MPACAFGGAINISLQGSNPLSYRQRASAALSSICRTTIKAGHHAGEAGRLAQTHASAGATAIWADHLPDAFFRLCRGHHIWPDNWLADILGRHMITAFRPDIFGQIILACAGYFFLAVLRKSSRCGITALACASKPS